MNAHQRIMEECVAFTRHNIQTLSRELLEMHDGNYRQDGWKMNTLIAMISKIDIGFGQAKNVAESLIQTEALKLAARRSI